MDNGYKVCKAVKKECQETNNNPYKTYEFVYAVEEEDCHEEFVECLKYNKEIKQIIKDCNDEYEQC